MLNSTLSPLPTFLLEKNVYITVVPPELVDSLLGEGYLAVIPPFHCHITPPESLLIVELSPFYHSGHVYGGPFMAILR